MLSSKHFREVLSCGELQDDGSFKKSVTYVVAREVVDGGLGQHAVVLKLRLAERRSVASNDDELGLAGSEALEGRLVTKSDLSGLHNKRQLGVDAVGILLALLLGGHFD
jgi:hypothetical protein